MQAKAFNPQVFLECLCYSAFSGLIFLLVSSGKYLSYVTPRMGPYLYFSAIVTGIWALAGLFRLFRPQHIIRSAHCFVLAIPILLLLLPHTPLSTSDLSGKYIGGNTLARQPGQKPYSTAENQASPGDSGYNASGGTTPENSAEDVTADSDIPAEDTAPADSLDTNAGTQASVPEYEYPSDLPPGLDMVNKKITVSNEDFGTWLPEIYLNMEKYQGYTIVITGFVFKDPEMLKADEFVPARLMMSCCAADLAPVGLLCKYGKASELKAESWVTVEGTLFVGQYENEDGTKYDDPQLTVTKITPAEPVEDYVYPY